jgi:hypothetical protein
MRHCAHRVLTAFYGVCTASAVSFGIGVSAGVELRLIAVVMAVVQGQDKTRQQIVSQQVHHSTSFQSLRRNG